MNNNPNDEINATDAIQILIKEFGSDDIYTKIIIEEIFKELMGIKEENVQKP